MQVKGRRDAGLFVIPCAALTSENFRTLPPRTLKLQVAPLAQLRMARGGPANNGDDISALFSTMRSYGFRPPITVTHARREPGLGGKRCSARGRQSDGGVGSAGLAVLRQLTVPIDGVFPECRRARGSRSLLTRQTEAPLCVCRVLPTQPDEFEGASPIRMSNESRSRRFLMPGRGAAPP